MKKCSPSTCPGLGCAECRLPDARTVVPGREVAYHEPVYDYDGQVAPGTGGTPYVDNPDHASLVARFDQLQRTLEDVRSFAHIQRLVEQYLGAAITLATLIREQVIK